MTPRCFQSLVLATMLGVAISASGCGNGDAAPDHLMDGSSAAEPPVALDGVDQPAVMTTFRIAQPQRWDGAERSASCVERGRGNTPVPRGVFVERVGVHSETVTFLDQYKRAILGCDNSEGPREENRRWCGGAYGQLYGGRLRDPRLNIGACSTDEDEPIAFVWVELAPDTRFLAVEQRGFAEVYEAAGGLPIRIATTTGFISDPLGVTVAVTEHGTTGNLLRSRQLDAVPAG